MCLYKIALGKMIFSVEKTKNMKRRSLHGISSVSTLFVLLMVSTSLMVVSVLISMHATHYSHHFTLNRISSTYAEYYKISPDKTDGKEEMCHNTTFEKKKTVDMINCGKMFSADWSEIRKATNFENDYLRILTPYTYIDWTHNCNTFLKDREYIVSALSKEETDFPIAYSIVIYKAVYQFERLLRSVYRPQNFYCVHIDNKMVDINKRAMEAIISCFDNVFLSSKSYTVIWGTMSVLKADLICMSDLLKYKGWKYFINLTGQDFPLKTNLEIVKILKAFNGANDASIDNGHNNTHRWSKAGPPPKGLIPYKGTVHVTVNRQFVEYAVNNETARSLLKWLQRTLIPDEIFFATLNHNPTLGIYGSFNGNITINEKFKGMTRFKVWRSQQRFCHGKFVRGICIPGVGDLPRLGKRPELFVNKLHWDFHHYVLDCLEERIRNRTVDGFLGNYRIDTREYEKLNFVKNAIRN